MSGPADCFLPLLELWPLVRAHLDAVDQCRLSWCASWLRALDPGPYLGIEWAETTGTAKDRAARAALHEYIHAGLLAPMKHVTSGRTPQPYFAIAWGHAMPRHWGCGQMSEWTCLRCTFPVEEHEDVGVCRAHEVRLYYYDQRWALVGIYCPRCNPTTYHAMQVLATANTLLQLSASRPGGSLVAWLKKVVPDDVCYTTEDGLKRRKHPDGTVCCDGTGCGDCGACYGDCDQGC